MVGLDAGSPVTARSNRQGEHQIEKAGSSYSLSKVGEADGRVWNTARPGSESGRGDMAQTSGDCMLIMMLGSQKLRRESLSFALILEEGPLLLLH